MGDFDSRIEQLQQRVGFLPARAALEVDQVYARYQHEGLDFRHPRGGQAKYLEIPLYVETPGYLRDVAARVLEDGLDAPLEAVAEDLSGQVFDHAPVEFLDLRASGHPRVLRGSTVVYDRPPMQPRLTEAQLRAKHKLRALGGSLEVLS